jgi:hypothetical protein
VQRAFVWSLEKETGESGAICVEVDSDFPRRMVGDKTLGHYNIQDGDQLDVVIEQTGGC